MTELIAFDCDVCKAPLEIKRKQQGKQCACPDCGSSILVPMVSISQSPDGSLAHSPTVGVQMGLPGGPGFKANVSGADSGKLAFTFLGGLLAIVGLFLGFRMGSRS